MVRGFERRIQLAFFATEKARGLAATGRPMRAGFEYLRAINHLLLYINVRPSADLTSIYYAIGAIGREAALVVEDARSPRWALLHAHMALAASHLADPADGDPQRIATLLAEPTQSPPRWDLTGAGPLTTDRRIAGAAEARRILAELMAAHGAQAMKKGRRWPVGSGGQVNYWRERRRFRQAILPSCVGLEHDDEARRLARESVLIYTQLDRMTTGFERSRDRAVETLDRVNRILGR